MRIKFFIPFVAALLLGVVSCSVKEDRTLCPGYLIIRSDNVSPVGGDALLSVIHENKGIVYRGWIPVSEIAHGYDLFDMQGVACPKGKINVSVLAGVDASDLSGDQASVVYNNVQADSLYAYSVYYDLMEEEAVISDRLRKNFSTITMVMHGLLPDYGFSVVNQWGGVTVSGLKASERVSTFGLPKEFLHDGEYQFRISRQGDMSLSLRVYRDVKGETKLWNTIDLADLMLKAGYDFDANELPDVRIDVDLTTGIVTVQVGDWEPVNFGIIRI